MMSSAVRLSGDCPRCGEPLVRRTRRSDRQPFLSCSGYPACRFAEDWDSHISNLARDIQGLRDEVQGLRSELRSKSSNGAGATTSDVSRALREIIAFAHPDRWPKAAEISTEIVKRLNALREKL